MTTRVSLAARIRAAAAELTAERILDTEHDPLSLRFEVRMHPDSLPRSATRFCGYSVVRSRRVEAGGAWVIETSQTPWAIRRLSSTA